MKYSIDLQDIINKNYLSLWNRYKPLQMVYYKKIPLEIRHDVYEFGFDEFRQDCYIVLVNAANSVDINKINNPTSYSFYVQYCGWLHNFTTRDIIRDYCNTFSIKYMDYDGTDDNKEWGWDAILEYNETHSNLEELVDTLPEKFQERCNKVAHSMRSGNKWPQWLKDYFMKYYTEY